MLGDVDALTDVDGDSDADGDRELDGESDVEADGEIEALGLSDVDADGEIDADGLTDADAEPDGLVLALADTDGLREVDGLIEALTEAEADSDGETDGLTDALGELALPGFVTSFSSRPSKFGSCAIGISPVTASPRHKQEMRRMLPALNCVMTTDPGMPCRYSSTTYSMMMSTAVAVVMFEPVSPMVIAVFTSSGANEAPSARTVLPVPPAVSTVLCVRLACAKADSLTLAAAWVPRMSTVVTAAAAPPIAIALQPTIRSL